VEWWQAVILGVVEGVTEYLPVSSTGHLILVSTLLGLEDPSKPEIKHAVDVFNIVIQGGAILAVLGLYWSRVVQMLRGLVGRDSAGLRLAINLVVAFLPAAIVGKLAHDWIEAHLFYAGPVVGALIVGGVYMMVIDAWRRRVIVRKARAAGGAPSDESAVGLGVEDVTIGKALVIGLMQCCGMWPGTSRSMMTITGGYLMGLRPAAAAEFSFLLGLPTLGAATLYSLYKNFSHGQADGGATGGEVFRTLGTGPVVIGVVVSAVGAAVAVKWLVGFLNRQGLTPFGWYRIVLGVAMLGLIVGEVVRIEPEGKAGGNAVATAGGTQDGTSPR
jgi:undecaprenyl-diphosphatase